MTPQSLAVGEWRECHRLGGRVLSVLGGRDLNMHRFLEEAGREPDRLKIRRRWDDW